MPECEALSPNVLGELNRRINVRAAIVTLVVLVVVNAVIAIRVVALAALVANVVAVLVKMGCARSKRRAAMIAYVVSLGIGVSYTPVTNVAAQVTVVVRMVVRDLVYHVAAFVTLVVTVDVLVACTPEIFAANITSFILVFIAVLGASRVEINSAHVANVVSILVPVT
jgi:hypothetical protein